MFENQFLAIIVLTFLLAGTVKGVIGMGLPTISLAILAVVFDLETAMALLLVPSFITNLWQGAVGGNFRVIIDRLWPFLLIATVTVWVGALIFEKTSPLVLTGLLGVLLMIYAALSFTGFSFRVRGKDERWSGVVLGFINGALTGMTGSFVFPGVMYLQALGFDRHVLVQAMGMLFTLSTLALGVSLHDAKLLDGDIALMSAVGLLPALLGMVIGQKIRRRLSELKFRRIFYASLLLMGGAILFKSMLSYF